jgi:hypothetical protein
MKNFLFLICLGLILGSCNNEKNDNKASEPIKVEGVPLAEVKLPFQLEKPYRDWQMGSNENVAAAMGALKNFVDKDFTAMAAIIGDSLEVRFDYLHAKMNHDSAVKFFVSSRPMFNDLTINMYDYESVISADKKDEWVTMWYKQKWTNEKGVADSMAVINDCKMKDGKLIELTEHIQHFPVKK